MARLIAATSSSGAELFGQKDTVNAVEDICLDASRQIKDGQPWSSLQRSINRIRRLGAGETLKVFSQASTGAGGGSGGTAGTGGSGLPAQQFITQTRSRS